MTTKITEDNIESATLSIFNTPKIASVDYPGDDTAANPAGGQTITVTGSGFSEGLAVYVGGIIVSVATVVNSNSVTFTSPAKTAGNYALIIVNSDGGTATFIPGIQYSGTPAWSTSAGSLATVYETDAISNTLSATSDSPVTYGVTVGSLPAGSTLNSTSGIIVGTAPSVGGSTTYNFTVDAIDGEQQETSRNFSYTVNPDVVSWSSPADGTTYNSSVGSSFTQALSATSVSGKTISYSANTLPDGLSIVGANITGTPTTPTTSTVSVNTGSLLFDSGYDKVEYPWSNSNFQFSGDFTIECFVNFTLLRATGGQSFIASGGWGGYLGDYRSFYFFIETIAGVQTLRFYATSDGTGATGATVNASLGSIATGTWYHLAVVRISGTIYLYRDGVLLGSGSMSTVNKSLTGIGPLQIGGVGAGTYDYYFPGYITNLRIVNGTGIYTSAFTPPTSTLTAVTNTKLLMLMSTDPNKLVDSSSNNLTPTLPASSTPTWNSSSVFPSSEVVNTPITATITATAATTNKTAIRTLNWSIAAASNKLWAWGWNSYGRLGLGDQVNKNSPVQVGSMVNWQTPAAATEFNLVVKVDGTLWVWGRNDRGQLGVASGDRTNRLSPTQVGAMTNWKIASGGSQHSVAVKTDGTLWSWGDNQSGQLGLGASGGYLASPNQVGTLTNWTYVATSNTSVLALKTDGTLWAWGSNGYGQLGLANGTSYSSPKQVGAYTNWQKIYSNDRQAGAIKTDGTLWTWGRNAYGIGGLGTSAQYTPTNSPTQVGTLTNWNQLAIGGLHMQATRTDGTLWAWGKNTNGQLGLGNTTNYSSPKQVGSLTNWSHAASGGYFTAAIKTNNTLWSWGRNSYSELGLSNATGYSSPKQIGSLTIWKTLPEKLGIQHTIVFSN